MYFYNKQPQNNQMKGIVMGKKISDYLEKSIKLHLEKNVNEAKRVLLKANKVYEKEVGRRNDFEDIKKRKNKITYGAHVYYSSPARPLDITFYDKNLCIAFCKMLRCLSDEIRENKISKGTPTFSIYAEFNKSRFPIPQSYWPIHGFENWMMILVKDS